MCQVQDWHVVLDPHPLAWQSLGFAGHADCVRLSLSRTQELKHLPVDVAFGRAPPPEALRDHCAGRRLAAELLHLGLRVNHARGDWEPVPDVMRYELVIAEVHDLVRAARFQVVVLDLLSVLTAYTVDDPVRG